MIKYYLNKRLKALHFFLLALFMYMFVYDLETIAYEVFKCIGFLFFSFVAFRFLDDAGSIRHDKIHFPERLYLNKEHYSSFLALTGIVVIFYLGFISLYDISLLSVLLVLLVASVLAYIMFQKHSVITKLIPLLKYPVLTWCVAGQSENLEDLILYISTFFIMLMYDMLEEVPMTLPNRLRNVLGIMICGILVFQPWCNFTNILWMVAPGILALLLYKSPYLKYLPIAYYPVLTLILNIIE